MKLTYKHTFYASYLGCVTQAIVVNLAPLLFFTFRQEFGITLEELGILVMLNFCIQIAVDATSAKFIDKIGYRRAAIFAHLLCCTGLALMGMLPFFAPTAFAGLLISTAIAAAGGGMIEVLISPLVEALPSENKSASMSLLHSFYCWGQVLLGVLSTLFILFIGSAYWYLLVILWATLPLFNAFLFSKVPICPLVKEGKQVKLKSLFKRKVFWLFIVFMLCAGATEQSVAQWVSFFAEAGLAVPKVVGDLLGFCLFAALMGAMRLYYGIRKTRVKLKNALLLSGVICVSSYLLIIFAPHPALSLLGCALCGLGVGMVWPGTISLSAEYFPRGGTAMFAFLAMAGDIGCAAGPGIVGFVSNAVVSVQAASAQLMQSGIRMGILAVIVFPCILLVGIVYLRKRKKPLEKQTAF